MLLLFLIAVTGFEYLVVDPVAERVGMGYALFGDGYSVNYNPAGIILTDKPYYSISYMNYICGTHFGYLGYEKREMGIGIRYFYSGKMKKTNATGYELGSFSTNFLDLNAGKSFYIKSILFGVTVKFVYENIDTLFSGGLGCDLGILYFFSAQNIQTGIAVKNIGTTVKPFIDEKERLPYEINLGIVKRLQDNWIGLDIVKPAVEGLKWRFGGEYGITPGFSLKASYSSLLSEMKLGTGVDFLTGLNIGFAIKRTPLVINYIYAPYFSLGQSHRVSIKLGG